MRLGRIIVALLTPLVSLPALAATNGTQGHIPTTPAADSLMNLLRCVVPMAASAAEAGTHREVRNPGLPAPSFARFIVADLVLTNSASEATLRLLTRQHHRAQLRC